MQNLLFRREQKEVLDSIKTKYQIDKVEVMYGHADESDKLAINEISTFRKSAKDFIKLDLLDTGDKDTLSNELAFLIPPKGKLYSYLGTIQIDISNYEITYKDRSFCIEETKTHDLSDEGLEFNHICSSLNSTGIVEAKVQYEIKNEELEIIQVQYYDNNQGLVEVYNDPEEDEYLDQVVFEFLHSPTFSDEYGDFTFDLVKKTVKQNFTAFLTDEEYQLFGYTEGLIN